MSERTKRVLLVEDEAEIRQLIAIHLKREGFEVVEVENGDDGQKTLNDSSFELAVLDWMIPGRNGLELTRWMRAQPRFDRMPILFVTAKTDPEHIATALDAGADDYLTKPFDTLVLMARVHALLRRSQMLSGAPKGAGTAAAELNMGELKLIPDSFESFLRGEKIDLTKSEFLLLEALMRNQGKVLSRESLIGRIQGDGVNVVGRTVDTHVFGLRKKLGDHADYIETIRGVGYRVQFTPVSSGDE